MGTQPSPDEYEGDWAQHTGDWRVNPTRHPDGLLDVASAIEKTDKRYLLWFEPERVRKNMPIAGEHPEYLIWPADEKFPEALMNLGREDSPYDRATLPLFGLQDGKEYVFEDVDEPDATFIVNGKTLCQKGLALHIPEKRMAKLCFYKAK